MAEITSTGFIVKTENEYFTEEEALYLSIDPEWNLDPSTPDGLKLAHDAEVFVSLDELALLAYNSKDPNKARDVDLNIISSLTGTFRSLGTPSNVPVLLSGVAGTVIIAGKRIESTVDGTRWTIDNTVTIGVGGTIATTATCATLGAIEASIGDITRIIDSTGGWQSVTNTGVATPGTDEQSNAQLRVERAKAVGRPGTNQIDSTLGEVFAVDGVRRAVVYENFTSSAAFDAVFNPYSLPAHSQTIIVDGGLDADIALAIFRKKNPGSFLNAGGTPVVVPDVYDLYISNKKTITFGRPVYIDIIVVVEITNDGNLPANTPTLVKQAILDYAAGDLVAAECGFNVQGFDIGEDVPFSRTYTPINQVIGQYGNSYVSNLTINAGTSNIPIAFNELSRWLDPNITVTLV